MRTLLLLSLFLLAPAAPEKVFLTKREALDLAFGEKTATVHETWYWTAQQRARIAALAGMEAEDVPAVARSYHRRGEDPRARSAGFDVRRVRTLRQSIMVVTDPDGVIERVEVLSFAEPQEYLPGERWYRQFVGHQLDEELRLKRGIHGITGATLTARATVDGVRELLATRQVAAEAAREREEEQEEEGDGGETRKRGDVAARGGPDRSDP